MSSPRIEESGNRYGRLVVLERVPGNTSSHSVRWRCLCDCGKSKILDGRSLRRGETRSCGCLRLESVRAKGKNSTHGLTGHPLYKTWNGMCHRCSNPENHRYSSYGGRGIQVYESWRDNPRAFIDWIEENLGARPTGHSLDRTDNDGNYEPGNLRWADAETQNKNRRRALYVSEDYFTLLTEPLVFIYQEGSS